MQDGRSNNNKGSDVTRSRAYVCVNSTNVSKVVGRIKGKSSLILFDRHPEYRERYNRHFWARGYYCETIGNVDEATITKYIAEQYERDRLEGETS